MSQLRSRGLGQETGTVRGHGVDPSDQFFVHGNGNDPGPSRKMNRHQGDNFGVGQILLRDLGNSGGGRNWIPWSATCPQQLRQSQPRRRRWRPRPNRHRHGRESRQTRRRRSCHRRYERSRDRVYVASSIPFSSAQLDAGLSLYPNELFRLVSRHDDRSPSSARQRGPSWCGSRLPWPRTRPWPAS